MPSEKITTKNKQTNAAAPPMHFFKF